MHHTQALGGEPMAEHVWSLLCDKVLIDPTSDNVSLIDITERLTLHVSEEGSIERQVTEARADGDKGILIPTALYLVSSWVRSDLTKPEEARFRYTLLNPAGDRVHEEAYGVDLRGFASQRVFIRFRQVPVSALGQHWILIEQEEQQKKHTRWRVVARLPLDLAESTELQP
jgi:hypothetical protein